jgi:DNA-binding IclR family transcriptional regulator
MAEWSPLASRAVTPPRRDSVQSLDRALDLLEALATGGEFGVTELANRTGLVPSTVHRLLATLAKRGYVAQSAESGRYRLGYKVAEIGAGFGEGLARLRAVAHPHLESISRETGETVNLVVLDGDRVVYVDQVEGTRRVRMFTAVGTAALAHTTGAGKAILAFGPPEALIELYGGREPLARLTPATLVTIAALGDDFARIRARGYALDEEEHEIGVGCIATPVLDDGGRPLAAISVSGPSTRVLRGNADELGGLLGRHAAEIAATLGRRAAA